MLSLENQSSLDKTLLYYFNTTSFQNLRVSLDLLEIIESNHLIFEFQNYFTQKYITSCKIEKVKNNLTLNDKKRELSNYIIRNNLNKKTLLFILKNLDKIDIFESEIDNMLSMSEHEGSDEGNDNTEINERTEYMELLSIEDARSLKRVDIETEQGYTSIVSFFELDKINKKRIEERLGVSIDSLIIKKNYLEGLYQSGGIQNIDSDIINYLEGVNGLFTREHETLRKLFGFKYFPYLLCVDHEEKSIYMSYCGEKINEINIPLDWKEQMREIIYIFEQEEIFHNDIWIPNFLVNSNTLQVIDFGFSTFKKENFPFTNFISSHLDESPSFFEFIDKCFKEGSLKRFKFTKKMKLKLKK